MYPKDTEAIPGGVDDMTKLSYLHEPGVLQNLSARYELNEIYVSNHRHIKLTILDAACAYVTLNLMS